MTKVLVTGHLGFIGSNIYNQLKEDGHEVAGWDIKEGHDVRDLDKFYDANFEIIYHTAAAASIPDSFEKPRHAHQMNVDGTLGVLEYAKRTKAKVVFSSSSSVYDPQSPYARQKLECEYYIDLYRRFGVKSVILRYFNVYGPGQEKANGGYALALAIFLDQKSKGEPLSIVGNGKQRRDFVHVKDVVKANLMASELDEGTFDVGTGVNYAINEIADWIDLGGDRSTLSPRIEPFENKADPTRFVPDWQPKFKLKEWINSTK